MHGCSKKTENYINNIFVWTLQSQFEIIKQTKPSLRGKGLHFIFQNVLVNQNSLGSRDPKFVNWQDTSDALLNCELNKVVVYFRDQEALIRIWLLSASQPAPLKLALNKTVCKYHSNPKLAFIVSSCNLTVIREYCLMSVAFLWPHETALSQ